MDESTRVISGRTDGYSSVRGRVGAADVGPFFVVIRLTGKAVYESSVRMDGDGDQEAIHFHAGFSGAGVPTSEPPSRW